MSSRRASRAARCRAAGAALLALGLLGCGDDKTDEGSSPTTAAAAEGGTTEAGGDGDTRAAAVEACSLISVEDASAILGVDVVADAPGAVSGGDVCEWMPADQAFYTVRLTVGPDDHYELLRSNQFTDLEGLGEEAWSNAYVSAGVPALDIGVRTGGRHVLLFFGETDDLAVGRAFTEAVLEGLAAAG